MIVHVQMFAVARQMAGTDRLQLSLPVGATVGDLRRALVREVPALAAGAQQLLFAIDADYVHDAVLVSAEAEIACIPPVSGG